jgi:hypothetical protein
VRSEFIKFADQTMALDNSGIVVQSTSAMAFDLAPEHQVQLVGRHAHAAEHAHFA